MSLIRHILTALAYALIAVAAALAAPQLWPQAGRELGAMLGDIDFGRGFLFGGPKEIRV